MKTDRPYFLRSLVKKLTILMMPWMIISCFEKETLDINPNNDNIVLNDLDRYIDENYTQKYNIAVRYKYDPKFVNPGQNAAPVLVENVRPMLDFIQEFWIDPYSEVENGETYFKRYVPSELVFLGGLIYNGDGTVTLGTADAGARITYTDVNSIDPANKAWRTLQLQVCYHEFAHIMHQEFKLPSNFEKITITGYTGPGSWYTLTDDDALIRGFVSPYATLNANEDFAENVAFYLFDPDYFEHYINLTAGCTTADCEAKNEGRKKIQEKINAILDHYDKSVKVDLSKLREAIQSRLPK